MQNKCRAVQVVLSVTPNLTFSKICQIEFFEKRELKRYKLCLELCKHSKEITKGKERYLCSFRAFLRT